MHLRRTVAVPYRQQGVDELAPSEFVVAVSLDREWFSPDQAKRLVDVAVDEGLLERTEDALVPTFDPAGVDVPEEFVPDADLLEERSIFERVLERLVEDGADKRTAVAGINALQADLALTIEAAALLYAHREGLDVTGLADRAIEDL